MPSKVTEGCLILLFLLLDYVSIPNVPISFAFMTHCIPDAHSEKAAATAPEDETESIQFTALSDLLLNSPLLLIM